MTEHRKQFPILGSKGATIDWQLVSDHGEQAHQNHGQSVTRLAERGGLSWCELFAVLHNRRWEKIETNDAMIACRALEAQYLAVWNTRTAPVVTDKMVDAACAVYWQCTFDSKENMRAALVAALEVKG